MSLFQRDHVIGVFRGFSGAGMEFHADLVLPYQNNFQSRPMHGQFVLVALESDNEAVLGRITEISSEGRLASTAGEDYAIRAVREERPIPEDLRDQYLKYRVDIRILGQLRRDGGKTIFAPSHRRVPHVGAKVAFVPPALLAEMLGSADPSRGAELGFLAYGEFVYAGDDPRLTEQDWLRREHPAIVARFDIGQLVSRRTFVFARAGFGKSNLVKLLFAGLYGAERTPTVRKRRGVDVPVGTLVFDPDGEYFWPDDRGRPGLCDVPALQDRIVVFTDRQPPSPFYGSFVVDRVKLDIRQLPASKVVGLVVPAEKLENQNVAKIRQLGRDPWRRLVNAVHADRHQTDLGLIQQILGLNANQEMESLAARANMVRVVAALHDPNSRLLDALLKALKEGKLCVVDISRMRGAQGLSLAGVLLEHIFDHNQEHFTAAEPATIPTIAVLEEAQSVLSPSAQSGGDSPFVAWVKEGRKYDLGAVLITQQPGSLGNELLSQGDNWFVFHLLSSGDLQALKRANAHFSDDLLSSLLNEPLVGHGVYWSSAGDHQYPLSVRVLSFEQAYRMLDPGLDLPPVGCYAQGLRAQLDQELATVIDRLGDLSDAASATTPDGGIDVDEAFRRSAIEALRADSSAVAQIAGPGKPWKGVQVILEAAAPASIADKQTWAYELMPRALDSAVGPGAWKRERRPSASKAGATTVWIVAARNGARSAPSPDSLFYDDDPQGPWASRSD